MSNPRWPPLPTLHRWDEVKPEEGREVESRLQNMLMDFTASAPPLAGELEGYTLLPRYIEYTDYEVGQIVTVSDNLYRAKFRGEYGAPTPSFGFETVIRMLVADSKRLLKEYLEVRSQLEAVTKRSVDTVITPDPSEPRTNGTSRHNSVDGPEGTSPAAAAAGESASATSSLDGPAPQSAASAAAAADTLGALGAVPPALLEPPSAAAGHSSSMATYHQFAVRPSRADNTFSSQSTIFSPAAAAAESLTPLAKPSQQTPSYGPPVQMSSDLTVEMNRLAGGLKRGADPIDGSTAKRSLFDDANPIATGEEPIVVESDVREDGETIDEEHEEQSMDEEELLDNSESGMNLDL